MYDHGHEQNVWNTDLKSVSGNAILTESLLKILTGRHIDS